MDFTLEELTDVIFREAKFGLDGGDCFGLEGEGFICMNLACPCEIVEKSCEAIVAVI